MKADILEALLLLLSQEERHLKNSGKSVTWKDLIKAMSTIQFDIRASSRGGLYSFCPNNVPPWYGKKKIILHKPDHAYEAIQMLKLGNRFADHYGWSNKTFVLKH
ncbi:hypothetical protein DL98DRAFT_584998 [Cadophora sp. DSE1049]|nr:hypothetical protein DL98DRAFT_584998 [Cadophora sp. DSE1049]